MLMLVSSKYFQFSGERFVESGSSYRLHHKGSNSSKFSSLGLAVSEELGNKQTNKLTNCSEILKYYITLVLQYILHIWSFKIPVFFMWYIQELSPQEISSPLSKIKKIKIQYLNIQLLFFRNCVMGSWLWIGNYYLFYLGSSFFCGFLDWTKLYNLFLMPLRGKKILKIGDRSLDLPWH